MFILVRLMISLAVLGGYGVQLYVAVQITWSHIEVRLKKKTDFKYSKYIYTASLILFACKYFFDGQASNYQTRWPGITLLCSFIKIT